MRIHLLPLILLATLAPALQAHGRHEARCRHGWTRYEARHRPHRYGCWESRGHCDDRRFEREAYDWGWEGRRSLEGPWVRRGQPRSRVGIHLP